MLTRLENNSALLSVSGRLDRELSEEYILTVKCFKLTSTPQTLRKQYDKQVKSLYFNFAISIYEAIL